MYWSDCILSSWQCKQTKTINLQIGKKKKKIGRTYICILKEMHTYIIFNISKGHNSKIPMVENYKISKLICNCNIFETLAHVAKSNMDYLL